MTAVHQEMVDIFTVHKFMKANCKAAQLHQDVIQVIQQLVASGQPLPNSSHASKKNKKQKITGEGKGTCNELLVLDALIMALHKENILDKLEIKLNTNIISKRTKTGNTAHGTTLFDKNDILLRIDARPCHNTRLG